MGAFDPSSFLPSDITDPGNLDYGPGFSPGDVNSLDFSSMEQPGTVTPGGIPPFDPGFPTNTQPDYGPLPTSLPGGIGMPGTVAGVPTSPKPAGTLQQIWGALEQGSSSQLPAWIRGVLNAGIGAGNIFSAINNFELQRREADVLNRELGIMGMGQNIAQQYARQIPSAQAGMASDIAQLQKLADLTPQQVTGGIRQYETPGMQPEQNLTARLNQLQQLGNLTPAQVTGGIQQYLQPLNQNLISSVNQDVARSLASQGLAQSPGMMSASTAQALAPWEQQNIQQAANQYFQQRGLQQQDIFTQIAAYQEDMIRAANEYFAQRGLQQQDIQSMLAANFGELGLPIEALNAIKYPNFFPEPTPYQPFIGGSPSGAVPRPQPTQQQQQQGGQPTPTPVATRTPTPWTPTQLPGPIFGQPEMSPEPDVIYGQQPTPTATSSQVTLGSATEVDPNTGLPVPGGASYPGYGTVNPTMLPYEANLQAPPGLGGVGTGVIPQGGIPGGMADLPNYPGTFEFPGGFAGLPPVNDLNMAMNLGSGVVPNIPGTIPGGMLPLPPYTGADTATAAAGGGAGGAADATSGAFKFGPWQIGGGLGQALSIASGVAMGAEIPLLALRIMGINPFSQAPSPQQIKLDDKVAQGVVNSGLKVINASGAATNPQMKQQNTQRIMNQVKSSMQYMQKISSMPGHSPYELQTAQQSLMQAAYQNLAKLGYTPEQIANLLGGQGAATGAAGGINQQLAGSPGIAQPTAPQYIRPAPPASDVLNRLMAGGA